MAKRVAEDVCAFYNRLSDKVEIVERLPRTKTDQTSTVVKIPAEDSLNVMLPIGRQIEPNSEKSARLKMNRKPRAARPRTGSQTHYGYPAARQDTAITSLLLHRNAKPHLVVLY
jgi:hypothetical protein